MIRVSPAVPASTTTSPSPGSCKGRFSHPQSFGDRYRLLRYLIWLYLILWFVEGGLRRWFLPGLATPLLFVRDPLVLGIYLIAIQARLFPLNGFIMAGAGLAFLTFASAMLTGHGNPLVAFYGMRSDFFHVPLIFLIGRVLRQKDLLALAKVALCVSIPNTLLLVAQFYLPQDAWVNRGVGGSLDGAGFAGALGRFRPPGTFSFITGTAQLYALLTAFWFALLLSRKFELGLMLASGVAILVAVPVSVSRGLFLSVVLVALVGLSVLCVGGRLSIASVIRGLLVAPLLVAVAIQLPAFKAGMEAFEARWVSSTTDEGGFQEAILGRVLNDLFAPFADAPFTGLGTGLSTNVGQKLLAGEIGFGASEGEWGRLLYDDGIVLGTLLILYRVALAGSIVLAACRTWRRGGPAIVFAVAACLQVLNGQWGQSTTLGAAVIAAGLALAAGRSPVRASKSRSDLRSPVSHPTRRISGKTISRLMPSS